MMRFILFALIFFVCSPAYAKSLDCGEVSRKVVSGAYEAAGGVGYFIDVRGDIQAFCSKMETLADNVYHNDNRDTKKNIKAVVSDIEHEIKLLEGSLKKLRVWTRLKTENSFEENKRRAHINKFINEVNDRINRIKGYASILEGAAL